MSKKKKLKRKRKISLPKDRNGVPINIGDWVVFDEGPIHVYSLMLFEDEDWVAGTEDEYYVSDNLSNGVVIANWKEWRK